MMICVLYNRYAYILLDLYGCVVVSFSQKMNLRFESSVNPEGSKTIGGGSLSFNEFESSVNSEGSKAAL